MASSPSSTSSSIAGSSAVVTAAAGFLGALAGYYSCTLLLAPKQNDPTAKASSSGVVPPSLLESPHGEALELAVKLALEAGSKMVGYLEAKGTASEASMDDLGIETKSGAVDFCTKVDVDNEALIANGINERFPDHAVIGEETVGTGAIPPIDPAKPTWIVDPIDGTTNFSAGLSGLTCVSIGYCVGGRPVAGVVYAPGSDELYLAVEGCGAYRNGVAIFQDPTKSTKSISNAVVCNEMGYARSKEEAAILTGAQAKLLVSGCRALRQLGSGCLDLCFVASGRLDVVYAGLCNEGWKPWDYAAALVICKEAGCTMESIEPQQEVSGCDGFDLYGKSVICGVSTELVSDLRSVLLSSN